jgi:osmotically-inducible protein OsmY
MRSTFTSQIALASQLFTASAGLYLLAPGLATAQTQATDTAPAIQRMSKADRELTRKVRRAVVSDKDLSVEAHNIHISAQDGAVTLIGAVKSDDEKKSIEDKAAEIAGAGKVTSQLTVSGK